MRVITLTGGPFKPRAAAIRGDDLYLSSGQHFGENGAILVVRGWRPGGAMSPPHMPPAAPPRAEPPGANQDCQYPQRADVAGHDAAWMHRDPDPDAPKIMGVPAGAQGLSADRCIRSWCHVSFRGTSGWVEKRSIRMQCN
jgi:hypothetical protein